MRKPIPILEKGLLRFYSKPLLAFLAVIFMAINMSGQNPTGTIVDQCICLSNQTYDGDGQFETLLRVSHGGSGPWYIVQDSVRGLYKISSPPPPAQPDTFKTGTNGDKLEDKGGGTFELKGIHIDGLGFSIWVTDGTHTLHFKLDSNVCVYPHTHIVGDNSVCEGQISDYETKKNTGSTYSWTLNHGGNIQSGANTNKVTVQWDDDSDGTLHDLVVKETSVHGCIVTDTMKVIIEDTVAIACNDTVQISLNANCAGGLTADMFLEGQPYPNDSYELIIEDENGNVLNQDTLSYDMVGKIYTITVRQKCTDNMCWSRMLVADKSAPEMECHSDTIKCSDSVKPEDLTNGFPLKYYTSINPLGNNRYRASGSTGCADVLLYYYDEEEIQECSSLYTSIIYRTWIASDLSNNQSSCIDTIYLERAGIDNIKFPPNWDGCNGNKYVEACSPYRKLPNGNPSPDVTGYPEGPNCGAMISFSDLERVYLCKEGGKSYQFLRHWIVMDSCATKMSDTLQIIVVKDTRKPRVYIPGLNHDTLYVYTEDYNCGSDVQLPLPIIRDCSSTTLTVGYQLSDGHGNFPDDIIPYTTLEKTGGKYILEDVPTGLARIKYTVKDECDNTTEKVIYIKVIDNLEPQAICDQHTNITLDENGKAYLGKITFDDGSYDNCTPVTLRVRRMSSSCDPTDTDWGEGIHFCCEDVGQPVMVQLEVTDAHGYTNSCMAQVNVQDKQKPVIKCPSNGTVSCKFDYSDLSVFGTVRQSKDDVRKIYINDPEQGNHVYFGTDGYVEDNCDVTIEELPPYSSINNCGTGLITRRFRAKDRFGNYSTTCYQRIYVKDFKPFNPKYDLIWPRDYTTTGCVDEHIDPDNLPTLYARPRITGDDQCSMISIDYDDLVFEHIEGMCYKIMRKWRVMDMCTFNANDPYGQGYWEYTQVIIVNDVEAPEITGCSPVNITALGDCEYKVDFVANVTDDCTEDRDIEVSYELREGNSIIARGTGRSFSRKLGKGNFKITWYAEDECGNIGECSGNFTIRDEKKPTPQCVEGLVTVLLEENGQVRINAADFNRHSTDDCTLSNYGSCGCLTDLKFSFSRNVNDKTRLLTCNDIENGIKDTIKLEMWVTDESGNQDFCNTYIVLQDNADVCPDVLPPHDTTYHLVSGLISTIDDDKVAGTKVNIYTGDHELIKEFVTGSDGKYAFDQLPDVYQYELVASKDGDYINGVSTLDLVLMQKHILGIKKLKNPYLLIAADVNNSHTITSSDILELRKLILGVKSKFKKNKSWRIIPEEYEFEDNDYPYDFEEKAFIDSLKEDQVKNFIAVKIGDINLSAKTNIQGLAYRDENTLQLKAKDIEFDKGENIIMPVFAEDDIALAGTQFTVVFDPEKLIFENISSDVLKLSNININTLKAQQGIITLSWNAARAVDISNTDALFVLKFKAKAQGRLLNTVDITSGITAAEAYLENNGNIEEFKLKLNFNNTEVFAVYQNVPNPFNNKTAIRFTLPEDEMVKLSVYDMTGKLLYQKSKNFERGDNEFILDNKDFDTAGILYYKVEAGQNSIIKKMILIK